MAEYSKKNFISPLKTGDVVLKIRDVNNKNRYTITACSESNIRVNPGTSSVIIQMKSESRTITLDFCDNVEARAAMMVLKRNLEQICKNAKDVSSPTGSGPGHGSGGGTGGGTTPPGSGIVAGGQTTLYTDPMMLSTSPFASGESRDDITFTEADFPTTPLTIETVSINGIELNDTDWSFTTPFTGAELFIDPPYEIDWDDEFIIVYQAPDP